jgi:pimeloyl-ACP methyl ester carboxylesterase
VPDVATSNTPVILFLHGYGGSFLWYQHYLSENFSNHIIVCPACGMSAATISQAYVTEALGALSKKLGFPLSAPSLIGLSAGGFGACRLYVATPRYYSQMVCLAAYPTDDSVSRFSRDLRPRFLSGATEAYVTSGDFQRRIDRVRRTCPAVEVATVPNADHFFLLTHPKETVEHLREWLAEPRH